MDNLMKTSIRSLECERLRKMAYLRCFTNADCKKVDKIIDGIASGKITKSNLYDEVKKLTKKVTSDHSLKRWLVLTEWFDQTDWGLSVQNEMHI